VGKRRDFPKILSQKSNSVRIKWAQMAESGLTLQ